MQVVLLKKNLQREPLNIHPVSPMKMNPLIPLFKLKYSHPIPLHLKNRDINQVPDSQY